MTERTRWLSAVMGLGLAWSLVGCGLPNRLHVYSTEPYREVLAAAVVDDGVDYTAITGPTRIALWRYIDAVARFGPTTRPGQFPTDDDALAYYLNTYNALVLETWLARSDDPPRANAQANPLWFNIQGWKVDGSLIALDDLERRHIRSARFDEPRVSFALVQGVRGSPPLLDEPFNAQLLDEQLDQLGRRWLAGPRAVHLDDQGRAVLPPALNWHRESFEHAGGLAPWLDRYQPGDHPERAAVIAAVTAGRVTFRPFDWQINLATRPSDDG